MTTLTNTELSRNLDAYLDQTNREPIIVSKEGRTAAVLISPEDFARLQALEDAYWSELARQGEASGYLTPEETQAYFASRAGDLTDEE